MDSVIRTEVILLSEFVAGVEEHFDSREAGTQAQGEEHPMGFIPLFRACLRRAVDRQLHWAPAQLVTLLQPVLT